MLILKLPDAAAVIGAGDGNIAINPADPTTYHETQSITLFDDAGESYTAVVYYQKIADNIDFNGAPIDRWRTAVHVDGNAAAASTVELNFDQNGAAVAGVIGANNADGTFAAQTIAASPVDARSTAITLNVSAITHTKNFEIIEQAPRRSPQG